MKSKDSIKISVRIDKETYNRLCKVCKEDENISKLVRDYIDIGLGIKSTSDDIDRISEIVWCSHNFFPPFLLYYIQNAKNIQAKRLIKIVIKNIKSSETSKNILYELLKEFSQSNPEEIIEKAERQAIIYATNRNN